MREIVRESERQVIRSHVGSCRRPTLWLEFPLTLPPPLPSRLPCKGDQQFLFLAFLVAGLAATAGSRGFGFRAGCAAGAGLQSPQGPQVLQQWQLEEHVGSGKERRGRRKRRLQPRVGLDKYQGIKELDEAAALQTKAETLFEGDNSLSENLVRGRQKLAERNARPPETAVFFVATTLQRHKALQEKEQAKLAELEERAKNAAKAVDEARQKGSQTPGGDRPAAGRQRAGEGTLGTSTKPCVTLSKSFPPTARLKISSHRWMQQLSAATPTPPTTDRSNDVDMAVLDPIEAFRTSNVACTRPLICFLEEGGADLSDQEREAKKQKFQARVVEERDL